MNSPKPSLNNDYQQPVSPSLSHVFEPFINIKEVARRMGKSSRCMADWKKRGWLPHYKIGSTLRFKWSEIEAFLARNYRVSDATTQIPK